ncbi:MAG: hypothetical protein RLZZ09_2476 [Pseudomonadota bacterium]
MNELWLQHLDLIAAAPDGVKRLRELILELAVRGKLVPQDPNDEPASELLKRIQAEKARLVAEGKIKKDKPLPAIGEEEQPFELPVGWEWVLLGDIAVIERGGSPRPIKSYLTNEPDGLNWIKIGDTDKGGKYIITAEEKIKREGLCKTRMVYPGDFLLTNSMSFGRPYITQIEGCIHDGWLRISPPKELEKDYLYLMLSSPYVRKIFVEAAAGAVVMNLNADKVRVLPIPLPPLAEQHRIVAKVDELMALCDQLEAQQLEGGKAHATLVKTLLDTLTTPNQASGGAGAARPDRFPKPVRSDSGVPSAPGRMDGDFTGHWERIATHFDALFTTEASIDGLKQTILQLAVMGKLVPQNPDDEPASELLKRILAEKARLVAEGKIKKDMPLPAIGEEEKPFELPMGWELVRLGVVIDLISGQHLKPDEYFEGMDGKFPYLTGPAEFGYLNPVPTRSTNEDRALALQGDILLTVKGSGVGKTNLVSQPQLAISRQLMAVRPIILSIEFVHKLLSVAEDTFQASTVGIAIPGIGRSNVQDLMVGLPPLPEQHRIVAKVDELMALCDQLADRLKAARERSGQYATAATRSALEAA